MLAKIGHAARASSTGSYPLARRRGNHHFMADTKMIKSAGEHWVCSALARHGWAPALTRDGLERTDILAVATYLPDWPTVEIQVKAATQRGDRTSWPVGLKAQAIAKSEREWFAFVLLPGFPSAPRTFVIPRDHVSAATWIAHQDWRTDPTVPKGKRNASLNQARVIWTVWHGYEDRWDLLPTPTSEVPVLLPGWMHGLAQDERVGLPNGHPWKSALPDW
jgi:hypothetical protein